MAHTNAMVAHLWAQQDKSEGRSNNGNFSFNGRVLYSYSTPIAAFVDSAIGEVILITSESFSMTTSAKHMPALWRAIDYGRDRAVFRVPGLVEYGAGRGERRDDIKNADYLVAAYREEVARLMRKQETVSLSEYDTERLGKLHAAPHDYGNAFGVIVPELDLDSDIAAINARREKRAADNADPVKMAKRKADRVKRAAAKERKEAERLRLERMTNAEKIEAWLAGSNPYMPHGARIAENNGAYLRKRGDILETSLGATVPWSHALKVFAFVKHCRETGTPWKRNGVTIRVGHFQVDSVDANGDFIAGCHRINWPEIEALARRENVLDMPASVVAVESVA